MNSLKFITKFVQVVEMLIVDCFCHQLLRPCEMVAGLTSFLLAVLVFFSLLLTKSVIS